MKIRMPYAIPPTNYEKANRALCIELYNLHRSKGVKGERWIKEGAENRYGSDKSIEQLNSAIKEILGE